VLTRASKLLVRTLPHDSAAEAAAGARRLAAAATAAVPVRLRRQALLALSFAALLLLLLVRVKPGADPPRSLPRVMDTAKNGDAPDLVLLGHGYPVAADPLRKARAPPPEEVVAPAPTPRPRASSAEAIAAYLNASCSPPLATGLERPARCVPLYSFVAPWIDRLSTRAVTSRRWLVVDVGAGKGYHTGAALTALGVPGHTADNVSSALHHYASDENMLEAPCVPELCGGCCDCRADRDGAQGARVARYPPERKVSSWTSIMVEPTWSNWRFLDHHFLKGLNDPTGAAQVHHAYIAQVNGDLEFPDCGLGSEDCRRHSHPREAAGQSKLHRPLDEYVPAAKRRHVIHSRRLEDLVPRDMRYIDMLLTDAEGGDYDVAESAAERFFSKNAVGFYSFEAPAIAGGARLTKHLRRLARVGMVCYLVVEQDFDDNEQAAGHRHGGGAVAVHAHRTLLRANYGCEATELSMQFPLDNNNDAPDADNNNIRGAGARAQHDEPTPQVDLKFVCASRKERHLIDVLRQFESGELQPASAAPQPCVPKEAERAWYTSYRARATGRGRWLPPFDDCVLGSVHT
jgi:hypothetical protein